MAHETSRCFVGHFFVSILVRLRALLPVVVVGSMWLVVGIRLVVVVVA